MLRCLWKARAWAVLRHGTTVPALMRNVTGFGRGTVLEGINPGVLLPPRKGYAKTATAANWRKNGTASHRIGRSSPVAPRPPTISSAIRSPTLLRTAVDKAIRRRTMRQQRKPARGGSIGGVGEGGENRSTSFLHENRAVPYRRSSSICATRYAITPSKHA